jgi:hypothetical protein
MTQLTNTTKQELLSFLLTHELLNGLGTRESPCSIAAINLILNGRLSDHIPDCMSRAIGKWILVIQDRMSSDLRNSLGWKTLLPHAAGTGRDPKDEEARVELIRRWMWEALSRLQETADECDYGEEWATMLREQTPKRAREAHHKEIGFETPSFSEAEDGFIFGII